VTETNEKAGAGRSLLVLSGSLLIIIALAVLLMIGVLTYQIFYQPDQVYLIKYLMDTIDLSDKAFFGRMDNADFFVHMSDPIKYFLYLMATFLIISIVVKIFTGILSAGVSLIKMANNTQRTAEQ